MKIRLLTAITVSLLVLGASSASAHTVLVASNPAKGSVVPVTPKIITLRFAEALLTLSGHEINKISLAGPGGKISLAPTTVKGAIVQARIINPLIASGKYQVSYRVTADDGHIVTGSFFFTLRS